MISLGIGIEALGPTLSGIGRYTKELCRGMASHPEVGNLRFFRFDRWYAQPDHFLSSTRPPHPRLPRLVRQPLAQRGFSGRLFHGPNYFVPPQAERAVITVHDLSILRFPEMHPAARLLDFERNFARSLDQASHIITDSCFIKREIEELLGIAPDRVTAIPLGVDPTFFEPRDGQADRNALESLGLANRRFGLCVATLEPRKGLDKALQAFRLAREREPYLPCDCLVIVGAAGWENGALHALLEPAVACGEVVLPGYVPERLLHALYAKAEVFLYPSAYEGFGLPPLEAMALGAPAVVTSRASVPEVVGNCALMADPNDIDALATAITAALTDAAWRQWASHAGPEQARRFTWDRCVAETIAVYRKVLAQ